LGSRRARCGGIASVTSAQRSAARSRSTASTSTVERLTAWVAGLQTKTLQLLRRAEDAGDLGNARGLIGEARRNLELLGRITGILEPNAAVVIDQRQQLAVLNGLSEEELRALARGGRHGLSESSIRRHRDAHLSRALGKAIEEKRLDITVERLTGWVGNLQLRMLRLLERAEGEGDLAAARGLIGEARRNLELLARVAGILDSAVVIDQRQQLAVLSGLTEEELRALARGANRDPGVVPGVVAADATPLGEPDRDAGDGGL
jgi:hypothetical protein